MSSEWARLAWGDVASLEYGKALRDYQHSKAPFPVYGTNGPIGSHDVPLCNSAGVVIGRKGAYRGVHFSPRPFYVIDTAFYLKPRSEFAIDAKWAYYCLLTYDINSMDSGSAIPSTSREEFYKLPVLLPPIDEQQAISTALGTLDDRIALLRETNTTLEAIAQALFKSWFVDFEPVRAKQQGLVPAGMDEGTAALFPDSFEASALGPVPRAWSRGKVEDLLELAYGKALKATDRVAGDVPVYGSGGVTGLHSCALVDSPTVVVGRKGTVGSLYWEDRPCFPIDTVFYVRARVPLTFCFYQLRVLGLEGMNTDGAVPGLNRNNVYRLAVVIPPPPVLAAFDELAANLRSKIFSNETQAQTLATLRDTLLPRLISGQLRLPEALAEMEEAA
ncbi:MAG: restriction endonuclease subunit S [Burkholderiales bacterium]|nr:restriction endonuclease subunit S [Burkholderiales bacterium]